jgi:excisionase family DNA binding protein
MLTPMVIIPIVLDMIDDQSPVPGYLTVVAAAERLAVSEGRVKQLIWSGALPASRLAGRRTWLIPLTAVEARVDLVVGPGRVLTPANAWGLLCLSDGRPMPWLDARTKRRLVGLLKDRGLEGLRARLVERGRPRPYRTHPKSLERVRSDGRLMLTGVTGAAELRLGLIGGDRIDAYVADADLEWVAKDHRLRASREANVTLRVVPDFGADWPIAAVAPLSAIALDLLEGPEPRARQVGREVLRRLGR